MSRQTLAIGVDIGGTKVAAGVVDPSGSLLRATRAPMTATGTAADGLAAVAAAIDTLFDANLRDTPGGIGICAPGPLDPFNGIVVNPPNLPCWRNFPLAAEVARRYKIPVRLDNDANAAALAEEQWGAGRGYKNVFYATIGTGIGTGLVFNGKIFHGRTGAAGEGGHMSIDRNGPRCACGKPGCIEALAAGPAIARRARAKLEKGANSIMLELVGGKPDAVTSEIVGQACAAGDPLAKQVLLETIELLALWLGNVIDLLDPDVIIIGGGVAAMLEPWFGDLKGLLPDCSINSRCQEIPILPARYGADAGIAGGAALISV